MRILLSVIRFTAASLAAAAIFGSSVYGQGAPAYEPDTNGIPAMPKGRPAGIYQQRALSSLAAGRFEALDTLEVLVIRVSFADLDFTSPPHDSLYFANELRHTWEYFRGASLGRFGLGWEIAAGVTTLSFNAAYYGKDDLWEERVSEILMEVVAKNDDEIDFSRFDAFALIHPGAGQETDFSGDSPWQLWSGFIDPEEMGAVLTDTLGTPGIPTNDLVEGETFYVDNVMVLPENASQDGLVFGSLGIYAYQVGMRLGMIPMYDTTPSGYPDSQGIGAFGLMGYGLYNASGFIPAFPCAFHRYLMGWVSPVDVDAACDVDVTDINSSLPADTSLVRIEISPTEYFLVSNRVHDRNMNGRFDFGDMNGDGIPENEDTLLGAEFDFFLTATTNPYHYEDIEGVQVRIVDTGSGIMIWHIDETIIRNQLAMGRYPNDNPGISGVDLEEADGVQDLDRPGGIYAFGSWGDSYRTGWYSEFGPGTIPASFANTGTQTGLSMTALSVPGPVMGVSILFGEELPRVTGEISGTVMGLSPVPADLDEDMELELVQAADTGKIYIAWDGCHEAWDGSFDLAVDIPGAVWTGSPAVIDLDRAFPMEILAGSRDGRIHAYSTDGSPFPIDTGPSPGSLEVKGKTVSMPTAVHADLDPAQEAVFLVSDGDSSWFYLIGCEHAEDLAEGAGGFMAGDGVLGMFISQGRIISHPVPIVDGSDTEYGGFCALTEGPDGTLRFIHIKIRYDSAEISINSWNIDGRYDSDGLILPACGDIDGNRTDDVVFAIPGAGIYYMDVERGLKMVPLDLYRPSPPSLADINGDGNMETLIRDRDRLFMLTGLGSLMTGWPVQLEKNLVMIEPDTASAQPAAVDVDQDGRMEAVFNVAGELRVLRADGSTVEGWPLRGEGDNSITPAFCAVPGAEFGYGFFIFVPGGSGGISGAGQAGTTFFPGVSTVSRIRSDVGVTGRGTWPMYRFDAAGTSKQYKYDVDPGGGPLVDGNSMKCYPNPATGSSFNVRIDLSDIADVTVRLFNLEGTQVYASASKHEWAGDVPFETSIPTAGLASGIYLCHVHVQGAGEEWSGSKKVAILK
jgi:M6 family metalloprotease-like protein